MNNRRRSSYYSLPFAHQALLRDVGAQISGPVVEGVDVLSGRSGYRAKLDEVDDRIRRNADMIEGICGFCRTFLDLLPPEAPDRGERASHSHDGDSTHSHHDGSKRAVSDADQDRVRTTLKQMARDWSADGERERDAAYGPIIDAVMAKFGSVPYESRGDVRILVPGAGLGRLAFEFAMRGFSAQGNEFSYFMLLPSHFLLNNTQRAEEHVIYPYVHSQCNWRTTSDMLRPVKVPDVLPSTLPVHVDFSMVAGEVRTWTVLR